MGYMSAIAKVNNKRPKLKSKTHKQKEENYQELLSKRLYCEKCKTTKTTLYKTYDNKGNEHYYCKNCK